jgi:MOSC domain-containing protein YiiM
MSYQAMLATHPRHGVVEWIGIRPQRRAALSTRVKVKADPASGLEGDHYSGKVNRQRQVTLLQREHLAVVAALLGKPVPPEILRRNLVVGGINLLALKGQDIQIGTAILRITGACHPCSRMEEALGLGGYNAMRGHGGVTAEILQGGFIALGDPIVPLQGDLFGE